MRAKKRIIVAKNIFCIFTIRGAILRKRRKGFDYYAQLNVPLRQEILFIQYFKMKP